MANIGDGQNGNTLQLQNEAIDQNTFRGGLDPNNSEQQENVQNSDSDDLAEVQIVADEITETLHWLEDHVKELSSTVAGARQLKYLNEKILSRMKIYRSNVSNSLSQRKSRTTWSDPDTLFVT